MSRVDETRPLEEASRAGNAFVHTAAFEWLSRAGFATRGLIYGMIGLLAAQVALGTGGQVTDQQGAFHSIAAQPFGHVLLIAVAIGLGGYSLWRICRFLIGHGPEGADHGVERIGALGSGVFYGILSYLAIDVLLAEPGSSTGDTQETASTAFTWPGGRWLIVLAGLVMVGVGIYQAVRGITRQFLEDMKTSEMSPATKFAITWIGAVGHLARSVVFVLIGIFLIKAGIELNARDAIGIDGALAELAQGSAGPFLLGIVSVGLLVFGLYSMTDARYRRI